MKRSWIVLSLSLVAFGAHAESAIQIRDAWVRVPNPATHLAGGYMMIVNLGDSADAIVGASSSAAEVVEIHEMKTVEGVMRMSMLDRLEIPARSSVKLEPGGQHLMFIRLTRDLKAGDTVDVALKMESGKTISVSALVKEGENER